jgi:hypothetical protein
MASIGPFQSHIAIGQLKSGTSAGRSNCRSIKPTMASLIAVGSVAGGKYAKNLSSHGFLTSSHIELLSHDWAT